MRIKDTPEVAALHAGTHKPGGGDEIDTVITSTGPYTLTQYNVFVFATAVVAGGTQAISLPTAVGFKGKYVTVQAVGASAAAGDYMYILATGGEQIKGVANETSWSFKYPSSGIMTTITLVSDGADWIISNIEAQAPMNSYTNASSDPTVTDDSSKGYSAGSGWLNLSAKKSFKCLAASVGAAVWKETSLPTATEAVEGALEIATTAEAKAGASNAKIITPARMFDILNASTLKNSVLNSNFDVWQRGTSFSNPASNAFTADRWLIKYDGAGSTFTTTRQGFTPGQVDVPNEPAYFMRYDVTTAGTGETFRQLKNIIESVRLCAGEKATLSFYAKASGAITLPSIKIQQNFGTGGSPSSQVATTLATNVAVTTSWQKFTYTLTVPSISGKTIGSNDNNYLAILLALPINSLFQCDISHMQFELGEVATTFEKHSVGHELMHCQRYYIDFAGRTINGDLWVSWPVQMRSAPTLTATAGTVANATVNGCTVNNSAAAATVITAAAEM